MNLKVGDQCLIYTKDVGEKLLRAIVISENPLLALTEQGEAVRPHRTRVTPDFTDYHFVLDKGLQKQGVTCIPGMKVKVDLSGADYPYQELVGTVSIILKEWVFLHSDRGEIIKVHGSRVQFQGNNSGVEKPLFIEGGITV
jgi:hypothetical protein